MSQPFLTRIPREVVLSFCESLAKRRHRMPGNPFPPDSPWGRELDDRYNEDLRREPRRRASA